MHSWNAANLLFEARWLWAQMCKELKELEQEYMKILLAKCIKKPRRMSGTEDNITPIN